MTYDNLEAGPVEYEFRAVAFLDVLGWKDIVNQSIQDPRIMNGIISALRSAHQCGANIPFGDGRPLTPSPPCVSQFSDSVIISSNIMDDLESGETWSMENFFNAVERFCINMVEHGFFVRGGMSCGLMYHEGTIAFGPALTEAATLEQHAIFPRILAEGQYIDSATMMIEAVSPIAILRQSADNRRHFDYLKYPFLQFMPEVDLNRATPFYKSLRTLISNRIMYFSSEQGYDDKILDKYKWLAGYFNEVVKEMAEQAGQPWLPPIEIQTSSP